MVEQSKRTTNKIKKVLRTFGAVFILLSIIELINIVLLWNSIFNLDGRKILFHELILTSNIFPSYAKFLFLFLICSIGFFLIVGILHWKITANIDLYDKSKPRQVLFLGVIVLAFSYIKLGYIIYFGSMRLNLKQPRTFLSAVYNSNIVPFYVTVIWVFFISVVCCYLMIGLFEGAGGLKWSMFLRDNETGDENES